MFDTKELDKARTAMREAEYELRMKQGAVRVAEEDLIREIVSKGRFDLLKIDHAALRRDTHNERKWPRAV